MFKTLKNLSLVEVKNKLFSKGLDKNDIEDYFYDNQENLNEYERKSIRNIFYKKQRDMDLDEIKQYLLKKGYKSDNINMVLEDLEI